MRLISSWKRRLSVSVALLASLIGGTFALRYSPPTSSSASTPATEKGLAESQNYEQKLMDQIRATQKAVQAALAARTAAVAKYANATGNATLLVQKRQIAPTTQGKTGASGGTKGKEFNDD